MIRPAVSSDHMLKRRKTDGPKLHMLLGGGKIDTSL
jgi:hypothetical protein